MGHCVSNIAPHYAPSSGRRQAGVAIPSDIGQAILDRVPKAAGLY
jgi:hypothetical protein